MMGFVIGLGYVGGGKVKDKGTAMIGICDRVRVMFTGL